MTVVPHSQQRKGEGMFNLVWRWRKWLPNRKGQRCRMLARGTKNSCLIEFEADGFRVITSRYAVRKIK